MTDQIHFAVEGRHCVLQPENACSTGNARDCGLQGFTDGVDGVKPAILAHAKCHSEVGQMLSRNQSMECAINDNGNN